MEHLINLLTKQIANISTSQQVICFILIFAILITFRDFFPGFLRCIDITYIASLEEKKLNHKKTLNNLKLILGESLLLIIIAFISF